MNNCNKASNNKYLDCPARMDDGRAFTDYRPSHTVDDMIRISNNMMTSFEYRNFLQANASSIMKINQEYLENKLGCHNCNVPPVPFQQTCVYNNSYDKCSDLNMRGIGLDNKVSNVNYQLLDAGSNGDSVYATIDSAQKPNTFIRQNIHQNNQVNQIMNNKMNDMNMQQPLMRDIYANLSSIQTVQESFSNMDRTGYSTEIKTKINNRRNDISDNTIMTEQEDNEGFRNYYHL